MDEFASQIEALEHQWMRAWLQRDRGALKALTARDFIFLFGSERSVILDRASWLDAATTRLRCQSYRFNEIWVRRHGNVAVFATRMTIETRIGARELVGETWITDLWQRGRIRKKWKLVERTLSRPDMDRHLPDEIRSLQLWR